MGKVNWCNKSNFLSCFSYLIRQNEITTDKFKWYFVFTEKGIAGHEIDLANKKVRVTSNTLDNKEIEDILKKTGLSTSFVGEKEA